MKISIVTLGCKTNQYESEKMAKELSEQGHQVALSLEKADLFILNTCSITAEADKKSRQLVARALKLNNKAEIFICGCSSQRAKEQFENKPNIVKVYGTSDKFEVINYIKENYSNTQKSFIEFKVKRLLKIQDGCDNFCSYCIIPYLRGRCVSRPIKEIKEELILLATQTKEVVLTAINLTAYGKDINTNLTELIDSLKDINVRISLGSLEPTIITETFLESLKNLKQFCPHFHISMQSGSDDVLKAMNRKYTKNLIIEKVALIRKFFEDAFIACDIIVGFPTETEENFAETMDTLYKTNFAFCHIFPYSKRGGTMAAKYKLLPATIVKERVKIVSNLNKKNYIKYLNSQIGKVTEVLIEKNCLGFAEGYSQNYIKCYIKTLELKSGEIYKVELKSLFKDGMLAEILKINKK